MQKSKSMASSLSHPLFPLPSAAAEAEAAIVGAHVVWRHRLIICVKLFSVRNEVQSPFSFVRSRSLALVMNFALAIIYWFLSSLLPRKPSKNLPSDWFCTDCLNTLASHCRQAKRKVILSQLQEISLYIYIYIYIKRIIKKRTMADE